MGSGTLWLTAAVAQNAAPGKSVMNMSLGGAKSNALNSAIAALTRAGVTVVVAAGNENVSCHPPRINTAYVQDVTPNSKML